MKLNSKDSDVYSVHGVCLLHCELHTVNVRFANTLRLTGLFVKYLFIHNDNHTKKQILVDNAGNCAHGVWKEVMEKEQSVNKSQLLSLLLLRFCIKITICWLCGWNTGLKMLLLCVHTHTQVHRIHLVWRVKRSKLHSSKNRIAWLYLIEERQNVKPNGSYFKPDRIDLILSSNQ